MTGEQYGRSWRGHEKTIKSNYFFFFGGRRSGQILKSLTTLGIEHILSCPTFHFLCLIFFCLVVAALLGCCTLLIIHIAILAAYNWSAFYVSRVSFPLLFYLGNYKTKERSSPCAVPAWHAFMIFISLSLPRVLIRASLAEKISFENPNIPLLA